jgi:succinate dehydrogenase/fumarate reductase flavoprotein subunit
MSLFDFDVVVVGSGAAGLTAAVTAAEHGRSTCVLEAADEPGGTTAKAAAWIWIVDNVHQRAAGIEDRPADALRYLARLAHPSGYDARHPTLGLAAWEHELLTAFVEHAGSAIAELERLGAMSVTPAIDFPDYFAHLPQNAAPRGRALYPTAGEGGSDGGRHLVAELMAAAERRGVELRFGHRVQRLLTADDGRVCGVRTAGPSGEVELTAQHGVLFASGGFTHDQELRREFLGLPYLGGCAATTCRGDFVRIGSAAGAQLAAMTQVWSAPLVLRRALEDPHGVAGTFVVPGDGMLMVNRQGRRVVNEKAPYNELVRAFFAWDAQGADYPNLPLLLIWDAQVDATYAGDLFGNPVGNPAGPRPWIAMGADLPALAAALEAQLADLSAQLPRAVLAEDFVDVLRRTVKRYGALAVAGVDEDFGRGETPLEQGVAEMFQMPARPNPTMRPLSASGPYFGTVLVPGTLDTKGGPRADVHGRILRADGSVIEGLYGAGNCVASPTGQGYAAAGGTLGPIITFAWLAGRHLAGAAVDAATTIDLTSA